MGTSPPDQCPVEGCDDPATETVSYSEETVTLCEPHAEMAENDTDTEFEFGQSD